jgi:hypothetical protein
VAGLSPAPIAIALIPAWLTGVARTSAAIEVTRSSGISGHTSGAAACSEDPSCSPHQADNDTNACQRWRLAVFLLLCRCHEGTGVAHVVPGGLAPAVGALDVGDAEVVDMAVDGIGDAAHVPADAKRDLVPRAVVGLLFAKSFVCFSEHRSVQTKKASMAEHDGEQKREEPRSVVALTTEIVTAYVTRNSIGMVDLGDLIGAVGRALGGLGREKPEPPKPEPAVAVRASGHDLGIF